MRSAALLLIAAAATYAQSDLPPQVLQLSRIKQHMKERLQQVPNYTCLQSTVRSERLSRINKTKVLDTVRLEVAEVDGKELFARPGQQFDQTNPAAFVTSGVVATGMFALFANALFVHDSGMMQWAGEEEMDGRKMLRYDFQVPLMRSGYNIHSGDRGAIVAYHGSFWTDPRTLDAFHLRVVADNIPPALGLLDTTLEIEYQTVRIGSGDALLPRSADLLLTQFSGVERRNLTTFSGCKQYGSESVLSFDTPEPPARPK